MIERRVSESMDTRKRNLLIGLGASILVIIAALAVLMALGGSNQDGAASGAVSADTGALHSSGDGTADNQVDAFEVYGDSADGAAVSDGDTPSVSGSGVVSGDNEGSDSQGGESTGGTGESGSTGSDEPAGGADPGVKTEADGSKWTGYY